MSDHVLKPEELLVFIELTPFSHRWSALDLDDEDDLTALQLMIMLDPKGGKVVQGTESIRKIRFAPARWNCGKSGAVRVLHVYLEEWGIVLLCLIYSKDELDNISSSVKRYLNQLVARIEAELRRRKSL